MMIAKTQTDFKKEQKTLIAGLMPLLDVAEPTGASLSLLGAAIAPLFTRLKITVSVFEELKTQGKKAQPLIDWIEDLIQRPEVLGTVSKTFNQDWTSYFEIRGSYYFSAEKG